MSKQTNPADTSAHTATPWRASGRYVGTPNHMSFIAECRDQNGNWSNEPMALANAEFIVRACNSYDALVAENARLLASLDKSTKALIDATGETA